MPTGSNPAAKKELHLQPSHTLSPRQRLIEEARAVGEHLCDLAIHRENVVGWLSIMQAKGSGDKWNLPARRC